MEGIQKTEQHLANLLKAKFPIIYVESWEENRVIDMIENICHDKKVIRTDRVVYVWSMTTGLFYMDTNDAIKGYNDIDDALNYFNNEVEEDSVLIMKDIHSHIEYNSTKRTLRDTANILKNSEFKKNVILITPELKLPLDLQKDVTVVDFELPSVNEIKELLDSIIETNLGNSCKLTEEEKNIFAKTAQGLTLQEAENAFARAMVERKRLTIDELELDYSNTAAYSPRVFTKAGKMTDKFLSEEVKYERLNRLNEKNKEVCLKSNKKFIGKILNVLVESKTEKGGKIILNSRAGNNIIVHFEDNTKDIGDFTNVKITKAQTWCLYGEPVNSPIL